jgi:hypothetical protein
VTFLFVIVMLLSGNGHAKEPEYQLQIDIPTAPLGLSDKARLVWEWKSRAMVAEATVISQKKQILKIRADLYKQHRLRIVFILIGMAAASVAIFGSGIIWGLVY